MSDLAERADELARCIQSMVIGKIELFSDRKGLSIWFEAVLRHEQELTAAELTRITGRVKKLEGECKHGMVLVAESFARAKTAEANLARAVEVIQFAIDGYDNHDVNHVDYRVKVYAAALDCLEEMGE